MLSRRDLFKRLGAIGMIAAVPMVEEEPLKKIWALGGIPETVKHEVLIRNNAYDRIHWADGPTLLGGIEPLPGSENEEMRMATILPLDEYVGWSPTWNPQPQIITPDSDFWVGPRPGESGYGINWSSYTLRNA